MMKHPEPIVATVYPRPRGGTNNAVDIDGSIAGLSPPTRGNRLFERLPGRFHRSIPAHAGEP